MTPEQLRTVLTEAASEILGPGQDPTGVVVRRSDRGDWETNLALRFASESAADLARAIAEAMQVHPSIASAAVSGPGFLTVIVNDDCLLAAVDELAAAGEPAGGGDRAADDTTSADLQLAHAHGRRLLRTADAAGLDPSRTPPSLAGCDPDERRLLVRLTECDAVFSRAAEAGIIAELTSLAGLFRAWAATHRLVPTIDAPITGTHTARLVLVGGLTTVLARGLRRLGVSAPERM